MITGLSRLTLAVRNLERSLFFYQQLLGFDLLACRDAGAYLSLGDLWLCLSRGSLKAEGLVPDYTHYAFSITRNNFDAFVKRLRENGVTEWQQNRSEGESLYFLAPNGHKHGAHVGDLVSRLAQCRVQPYAGMRFFN